MAAVGTNNNNSILRHRKNGKWWKCFVVVSKPNGKLWLCPDPARLNQVLVYRYPTVSDIPPKLALVDAVVATNRLMVGEKPYLTAFSWQFGRAQIQKVTIWNSPSRRYVPEKSRQNIKKCAKCTWYCWWHFDCRIWWQKCRPWCNTTQSVADTQKPKPEVL